MNIGHAHNWQPIEMAAGRYRCECGATAWRRSDGEIIEHVGSFKAPRGEEPRVKREGNWLTGRVAPKKRSP